MRAPSLHNVQIAISSRDTIEFDCQVSIANAINAGASCGSPIRGCPGLALARNRSLTAALLAEPKRDFIFTLDDDVSFTVEQLEQLVLLAERHQHPVGAAYPSGNGSFQYMPVGLRFAMGLGCVVFPRHVLETYAQKVERLPWTEDDHIWAFCQEGPVTHPITGLRHWGFDDYWLAYALGGFVLAPIVVRHIKKNGMHFDAEHIQKLIDSVSTTTSPKP